MKLLNSVYGVNGALIGYCAYEQQTYKFVLVEKAGAVLKKLPRVQLKQADYANVLAINKADKHRELRRLPVCCLQWKYYYCDNFWHYFRYDEDLRHLNWEESVTNGTHRINLGKYFYKLSGLHNLLYDYTALFEEVAYRLGHCLGLNVLQYSSAISLINLDGVMRVVPVACSKDYKLQDEIEYSLAEYTVLNPNYENIMREYRREIEGFWLLDYLVMNIDRHSRNAVFLVEDNSVRIAPIFDTGYAFADGNGKYCGHFSIMEDLGARVYCLGSCDWLDNIRAISKPFTGNVNLKYVVNCLPIDIKGKISACLKKRLSIARKERVWNGKILD